MQHSKQGIRVFGLAFLAVLGLMAFGTVVLKAALPGESTPGEFQLEPSITGAGLLGVQEGTSELIIPGLKIFFTCAGGHAEGSFIASSEALATAKFTGCKVFELATKVEFSKCRIINGTEKEVIAATARFLPTLHGGELFILGELDAPATVLAKIVFEAGKGCPLPLNNPVEGSVSAQAPSETALKPLITFSEAIQKLTGDKLTYGSGAAEAFINASATVQLTGLNEGDWFLIS